ncbi:pre-rRNA 2'-O-ribose RNA methyltransferase FTSJ3-like [Asterias amurensis]|uniref:pre-rRNA 2'-O-ribose RNA methyltransferase FTSJ3-like n=1 Tax=Asterias amurensis TaxID=7602 RepID=UPI003AB3E7BF
MGKKGKTGKQRKDRYYHLAKESGYRARSAFKLIQLNRKFQFLQKSRVLIDLCAAPGGWLQVASKNMPMSSLIVGVDLFPIRPIPHVTTLVADITTEKCRSALRKEIKTWKVDCVLHDGAPNVGTSWVLDAFTQAQLTLWAMKLASEFLTKGGWFVTKMFRSKDYQPIMWVLQQLFKKVHATKPQASRAESAEIFVVCQGYIAPDKIDPRFFDPKFIFSEVAMETKQKFAILADPNKPKKVKAEGYEEGNYTQHTVVKMSDFVATSSPVELLNSASELSFDDPAFANHTLTTKEIKHCCKDIKVLGRKEIRMLLNWQKKIAKEIAAKKEEEEKAAKEAEEEEEAKGKGAGGDGEADDEADDSEDELEAIDKQLQEAKEEEEATNKRKRKDKVKMRKKLRERLQKAMAMSTGASQTDTTETASLFALQNIKNKKQLQAVNQDDSGIVDKDAQEQEDHDSEIEALMNESSDESDLPSELDSDEAEILMEERMRNNKKKRTSSDEDDDYSDGGNSDIDPGAEDEEIDEQKKNPLMVDLDDEDPNTKSNRRTNMWFNKSIFSGLEADEDEDFEIGQMTDNYKEQGGTIIERENGDDADSLDEDDQPSSNRKASSKSVRFNTSIMSISDKGNKEREDLPSDSSDDSDAETPNGVEVDSSDSDYDDEVMIREMIDTKGTDQGPVEKKKKSAKEKKAGFEVVGSDGAAVAHAQYLDPEGLALGTLMATSKRKRREILEQGYNRFSYGEENLPAWFVEEEVKHVKKQLPVTKDMVADYRARLKEVNARPIKKIAEAKARKRQRSLKRMEKLRKKAEAIGETVDISEKEKMNQIKQIYKKAKLKTKTKEVTYIVAKKSQAAKKVKRPRGVKGHYKVVDPRMKKDVRGMKRAEARKKGKGKKR